LEEFTVVGRIEAGEGATDISRLRDRECLEVVSKGAAVGYFCRVGDRILPFGKDEIKVKYAFQE